MLGAGREHPVGLEATLGCQIVDQDADVRLVAAESERRLPATCRRRVDAGDQPLRRRLFVARRAVDLTREKESRRRGGSRASLAAPSAG